MEIQNIIENKKIGFQEKSCINKERNKILVGKLFFLLPLIYVLINSDNIMYILY